MFKTNYKKLSKFINLMSDEQVIYIANTSWFTYIFKLIFHSISALFLSLIYMIVKGTSADIAIGLVVIPIILMNIFCIIKTIIEIKTTVNVITNIRIISKSGLFATNIDEVLISDIKGINVSRNIKQSLFGIGNVIIGTAATGGAEIVMFNISNPLFVTKLINDQRKIN